MTNASGTAASALEISEPISARAWRALGVSAAGYVLFGFNSTATNLAFGDISDSFDGVSQTTVSWVASAYFIASAAFLPLGGRLADRVGRRRIFNIGLIGFCLSALLSAFAPTVWILIGARALQAASGALVIPASLAMILPEFPVSRRSTAVAAWSAAGPLAAAIAPTTAALLLGFTSWRWVYAVSAPVALITFVLAHRFVSESSGEDDDARLDLGGTLLAVAGIALLVVGISQGSTWGWTSAATVLILAEAIAMGVVFVIRSSNHAAPLLNLGLFRIPEVSIANLSNFFISVTSSPIWLLWPLWLGRIWGYEPWRIGLAITAGPIFAGTSTILSGRLVERIGHRWPMIVGTAISTSAVLWSYFMFDPDPNYWLRFFPTVAGFGVGWGMSQPTMNSWALAHVPPDYFGESNATFNTLRNIGAAVGTAGGLAILGSPDRPDALAAYDRANLFFAAWVGLSCLTVLIGTTIFPPGRMYQESN